jgi:GNAT superfamily N-acetyltransferase
MTPADQPPRLASQADLPAITTVIAAAYARYRDRMDRPPAPVLADYSDAIAAHQVWVTGQPVAAVLVLVPEHDAMLVENVAVSPAAQGTGLGRRLMEFAEEQAIASGRYRMTLYTNEVMTENLAIYTRFGYRETARHREHGYSRVFMEKDLRA